MSLLDRIAATRKTRPAAGRKSTFTQPNFWSQVDPWLSLSAPWSSPDAERIGNDFLGYVEGAYKSNGIVFACMLARQHIFSQIRFGWQEFDESGRPGDLVGSDGMEIFTPSVLKRMESDAPLAGNWFATVVDDAGRYGADATGPGRRVVRMRPDWVTIVVASPSDDPYDLRARLAGYWYEPMNTYGPAGRGEPTFLLPNQVAHYAPVPDPEFRFRGMSPLTPILREIAADKSATMHKDKFFSNGARLSTVVKFDKETTEEQFKTFVKAFNASHQGDENAYKTLFLAGGADVSVIGTDLSQVDFKSVQGGGETRVAAALRVHPVIVGLSEGMQGSSLNAGNYKSAKRGFVDEMMRSAWADAAYSLATLVTAPRAGVRMAPDDRDVAYLREDAEDAARILHEQATTAGSLVTNGWRPDEAIKAVIAGDLRGLIGNHSELFSVQLQPAGSEPAPTDPKRAPYVPKDDDAKMVPWERARGIKRWDPNQPRLPEGSPFGGRWLGFAIDTHTFRAADGDVDLSALGGERLLLSFEAGPDRRRTTSLLTSDAALDLASLLRSSGGREDGIDIGETDNVAVYPTGPDGKPIPNSMPTAGAWITRTGADTYELELLDTDDTRTLTGKEMRSLAGDVERLAMARRVDAIGGDLDLYPTDRRRVGVTIRPEGDEPVKLEFDRRSWGRVSYAMGAVFEGFDELGHVSSPDEDIDRLTVRTNLGPVVISRAGPAGEPTALTVASADGSWRWSWRTDGDNFDMSDAIDEIETYLGVDRSGKARGRR